jgi:hypothetical protein
VKRTSSAANMIALKTRAVTKVAVLAVLASFEMDSDLVDR